jgi:hypothetical protein
MQKSAVILGSGIIDYNMSGIYIEGRWIKAKSTGNIVTLRGVCKSGFLASPDGWWTSYNYWNPSEVREHLRAMRSWGVNCVRIVITAAWWIDDNITFEGVSHSYRQHLRDTIQIAQEEGIYVILAGWMILPIGVGDQSSMPIPPYNTPGEQAYFPTQQSFVNYMVSQAIELKDYPNVILEPWNEPANSDAETDWFNVVQQCINEIRKFSDVPILVHWGYCDVNDLVQSIQNHNLTGGNIIWSEHIYRFGGTFDYDWRAPSDYDYIKTKLDQCRQVVEVLNVPLLIGEIGANVWWNSPSYPPEDWQNEKAYFNNTLTVLNEWGVGYLAWEWFPEGRAWSLYDVNGLYTPNEIGQILIDAIAKGNR